jgi:hypothetical protein
MGKRVSFEPPRAAGRCPECGCHIRLQGHRGDCSRARRTERPGAKCVRCRKFGRLPGRRRLCAWCAADDTTRAELRRQAVELKLAEIDGRES